MAQAQVQNFISKEDFNEFHWKIFLKMFSESKMLAAELLEKTGEEASEEKFKNLTKEILESKFELLEKYLKKEDN